MSLALYRKYRPQTFQELVGQNHIKVTLTNEIEQAKLAHAYLFCGPRGIGKTTVARLLAKAVNCEKRKEGEGEPCNKCASCAEITEGRSLDIVEIDAASHTGVDNVRENIINTVRFTPSKRKFKVFIIDEVHMLSASAFNALLKTLEEPPEHAIFILATTEIHKVPLTIISRCQRFDFKKVNREDLINRLNLIAKKEKRDLDKEVIENIAREAGGSVRDAESLLGQIFVLGEKKITMNEAELVIPHSDFNLVKELVDYLLKKNTSEALGLVNRLVEERVDLVRFNQDLVEFLRQMLLVKVNSSLAPYGVELEAELEKVLNKWAKMTKLEDLTRMINLFLSKARELKNTEIVQLPLELAVVEICQEITQDENQIDFSSRKEKKEGESAREKIAKAGGSQILESSGQKIKDKIIETVKSVSKLAKKEDKDNREISLEEIEKKWPQVLGKSQAYNHSLVFVLKMAVPLRCEKNCLVLGFKYKLHQDKIKDNKIHDILDSILKEVFGTKIKIETKASEDLPKEAFSQSTSLEREPVHIDEHRLVPKTVDRSLNLSDKAVVDDVLRVFGGKLIE